MYKKLIASESARVIVIWRQLNSRESFIAVIATKHNLTLLAKGVERSFQELPLAHTEKQCELLKRFSV